MEEKLSKGLNKMILFVGAGISIPQPTALPTGKALTRYCLDFAVGEKFRKKILKRWALEHRLGNNKNEEIYGLQEIPRLETIIEVIYSIEKNYDSVMFIEGFDIFKDARFNQNHAILASFLKKGVSIITTNFDYCIEKAYSKAYGKHMVRNNEEDVIAYQAEDSTEEGKIYHIHGVADEYEGLGVTVNKLKNGLPESFEERIRKWITQSYDFYFFGYSGSDFFDVNYMFKRYKDINKSTAYAANYKGEQSIMSFNPLVSSFSESKIISCDTTKYLEELSQKYETEYIWDDSSQVKACDGWWKAKFEKLLKENNEKTEIADIMKLQIIDKLRVGYSLKVNIKRVIGNLSKYHKRHAQSLLSGYYNYNHKKSEYLKYYNLVNADYERDDRFSMDKYKKGDLQGCIKDNKYSLADIYNFFSRDEYTVNWEASQVVTLFQCYTQVFMQEAIKKGTYTASEYNNKKLLLFHKIIDEIQNKHFKNFTQLNQLCIMLRIRAKLMALENKEDYTTILNEALLVYSNLAMVDGFISVYRDFAIIEYMKIRLYKSGKYINVLHYYIKSFLMAFVAGSKRDMAKLVWMVTEKFKKGK